MLRQFFFQEVMHEVDRISRNVRNSEVQQVAKFILEHACLRIMEDDNGETHYGDFPFVKHLRKNYVPDLPIVFFTERVPFWCDIIGEENHGVYCREVEGYGDFIIMRSPDRYTKFFHAFNIFHEAKHAYDHRCNAGYNSWSFEQKELRVVEVERAILDHYFKKSLERLARKHYKNPIYLGYNHLIESYDHRLDKVFGPVKSDQEKHLRMDRFFSYYTH